MVIEQPQPWEAALARAHEERIMVERYDTHHGETYDRTWFRVRNPVRDSLYGVTITCNAHGVFVSCGCPAGQSGQRCKHSAAALVSMGLLEPATVPQPEPEQPARWISPADALARLRGAA